MKKVVLSIAALALLAGCSHIQSIEENPEKNSMNEAMETSDSMMDEGWESSEAVKEFTLTADNWTFTPSTISVKKGDTVRLKITSIDKEHGIAIPDFNINEKLPVGEEVVIEFVADKEGTFTFFCSVPCGEGHKEMTGQLVVEKAEAMMESSETEDSMMSADNTTGTAEYLTYSSDLYNSLLGKEAFALFFHAQWCPTCRGMEKDINAELGTFPNGAKIIQTDYDTENELKKKYGITTQSTIVIIDKEGNQAATLLAPNNKELIEALKAVL